jgi:energy-converting hydrogenase Eha subunit A
MNSTKCLRNGLEIPCELFWNDFYLMLASMVLVFAIIATFWLKMFVHCLRSDRPDKQTWTIAIIFTNIIGATIYYFHVYRAQRATKQR